MLAKKRGAYVTLKRYSRSAHLSMIPSGGHPLTSNDVSMLSNGQPPGILSEFGSCNKPLATVSWEPADATHAIRSPTRFDVAGTSCRRMNKTHSSLLPWVLALCDKPGIHKSERKPLWAW